MEKHKKESEIKNSNEFKRFLFLSKRIAQIDVRIIEWNYKVVKSVQLFSA